MRHILDRHTLLPFRPKSALQHDFRKNLSASVNLSSKVLEVKNLIIFICFFVLCPEVTPKYYLSIFLILSALQNGFIYQLFD